MVPYIHVEEGDKIGTGLTHSQTPNPMMLMMTLALIRMILTIMMMETEKNLNRTYSLSVGTLHYVQLNCLQSLYYLFLRNLTAKPDWLATTHIH